MTTHADATAPVAARRPSAATRAMLAGGVAAGPLFVLVVLIQQLTRDGFDPQRHPLSLLSLGDLGRIQITNFVVAGVLAIASAVGIGRVLPAGSRGATWAPRLIGIYGAAMIWGGVFVADPAFGFPPGTPDGSPAELSWHGILHGFAPVVAGLALVAACVVFARRFAALGHRGWVAYCIAAPVLYVVLATASFPAEDYRLTLAGGAVIWTWASAVTALLLLESTGRTR